MIWRTSRDVNLYRSIRDIPFLAEYNRRKVKYPGTLDPVSLGHVLIGCGPYSRLFSGLVMYESARTIRDIQVWGWDILDIYNATHEPNSVYRIDPFAA